MKILFFLLFVVCIYSVPASAKCRDAKCIYTKGVIEDFNDFRRVDSNLTKGYVEYQYKLDTALKVRKQYHVFKDGKIKFAGYSFYYNGIAEGKWVIYNLEGVLLTIVNMKNGYKDGFQYHYQNGKVSLVEKYIHGNLVDSKRLSE